MRDQIVSKIETHAATLREATARLQDLDRQRADLIALIQRVEGARQGLAELLVEAPAAEAETPEA